jgi:hypothetical protein
MDAMTEQLAKHQKRIEEIQASIRFIQMGSDYSKLPKLNRELDQLQKEAAIMTQEIKSGKNLD